VTVPLIVCNWRVATPGGRRIGKPHPGQRTSSTVAASSAAKRWAAKPAANSFAARSARNSMSSKLSPVSGPTRASISS